MNIAKLSYRVDNLSMNKEKLPFLGASVTSGSYYRFKSKRVVDHRLIPMINNP